MKKTLVILIASVVLAGCATQPQPKCVALVFSSVPSAELCAQLAATQPDTTAADVQTWFAKGERDFILSSVHTNEINAAIAAGAHLEPIH